MWYVYIIRSASSPAQEYTGLSEDLKQRLKDDNAGKSIHTSKYMPWELVWYCAFPEKKPALDFEKYLKSHSGRAFANKRLCSFNNFKYWQQMSEILLAEELIKCNFNPKHPTRGPDFWIETNGKKIWIEVVTPEPKDLPNAYMDGTGDTIPHTEILLRWTAAIKDKSEKFRKYKNDGLIGDNDICVIAINGRLLRGCNDVFPEFYGISQLPFAVEAALGVGPLQITIETKTMKQVSSELQHRPNIQNRNNANVASNIFLDSSHTHIDALWATDLDEGLLLSRSCSMAIIHNPNCNNKLPLKLLPTQIEYAASISAVDYIIEKIAGRLHVVN